jgi:hypothetical protein
LNSDHVLEQRWQELGDQPFDDDLHLDVDWWVFLKGTPREEIWEYFDIRHSRGVAWLVYEYTF